MVTEMHVDGFRFDVWPAPWLGNSASRPPERPFRHHPPGPILSQVKLIAEPWDVGMGSYKVGNFPVLWSDRCCSTVSTSRAVPFMGQTCRTLRGSSPQVKR
jgi:pullulanase/glycogen debranching enzyme